MAEKTYNIATVSVTQASADAFVQGVIDTQISTNSNAVWSVRHVDFYLNPQNCYAWANPADIAVSMCLTDASKTSVVDPGDQDWLEGAVFAINAAAAAVCSILVPCYLDKELPGGLLVASPALYFGLKTFNTGVANTAICRIWYEPVRVSEIELLRLRTL